MAAGTSEYGRVTSVPVTSWWIDTAVAVAILAAFWVPSLVSQTDALRLIVGVVLAATVAASITVRWRWPVAASVVVWAATLTGWVLSVSEDPMLGLAWTVYPLAVRRAPRTRIIGIAGVGLLLVLTAVAAVPAGALAIGQRVVVALGAVAASWLLGHAEGSRLTAVRAEQQARAERDRSEWQIGIARDVHDVVGHALAVISAQAAIARSLPDTDERELREDLAEIEKHARTSLESVQELVRILRDEPAGSAPTEPRDLRATLTALAASVRSTGVKVSVDLNGGSFPDQIDEAVVRVIQESLSNVIRHASATRCTVEVDAKDGGVEVCVEDDGSGAADGAAGGLGVRGMRERVELLGGRFTWDSREGSGTRVHAWIPAGLTS